MGVHRRRRTCASGMAAAAVAVVTSGTLVWNASYAAFNATTENSGNSWTAGTVAITNDQSGSAAFTVTEVKPDSATSTLAPPATGALTAGSPNSGGSRCFKVTYSGTTAADVRLYESVTNTGADGGLAQHLLMDVDSGTDSAAGTDPTCATYTSSAYLFGSASNTNVFANALPTTYAGGLAGWTNVSSGATRWYRISWLLPANVANAAQAEQVQITFTWEAQNT